MYLSIIIKRVPNVVSARWQSKFAYEYFESKKYFLTFSIDLNELVMKINYNPFNSNINIWDIFVAGETLVRSYYCATQYNPRLFLTPEAIIGITFLMRFVCL